VKKRYGLMGIALGVLVTAVGVVMAVIAGDSETGPAFAVGMACMLLGPWILTVGLILTVVPMRAPRFKLTTSAEGSITAIRETNVKVNGRQQYKLTAQFTTEAGQAVTADDYITLSILDLLKVRVGTPVSLRYNPANPSQARISFDNDLPADSPGVVYGTPDPAGGTTGPQVRMYELGDGHQMVMATSASLEPETDQDEWAKVGHLLVDAGNLARGRTVPNPDAVGSTYIATPMSPEDEDRVTTGVPAQAVVLQSAPTGAIVSGCAEMKVRAEVTRPDGTRFQAETTQPVDHAALPYTTPGSVVDVYYKPEDEQHITIRFGRA